MTSRFESSGIYGTTEGSHRETVGAKDRKEIEFPPTDGTVESVGF